MFPPWSKDSMNRYTVLAGGLAAALASGACSSSSNTGPPADPIDMPGDFVRSIDSGGRTRSFRIHIPMAALSGTPAPLFLVFHGIPSSAAQIETISDFNRLSNDRGFVVVYPAAVEDWNTGCPDCPGSIAADLRVDDVGFVKDLIRQVSAVLNIDTRRVYAAGFSNGALFVHRLTCEATGEITAFASVAATLIEEEAVPPCQPQRRAPLIAFHGSLDPSFPPGGRRFEERPFGGDVVEVNLLSIDESVALWASRNGCGPSPIITILPDLANDGTTIERHDYAGCAGAEFVFYSIDGGGHTWPGAPVNFAPFLGPKSDDIVASEVMAEFFLHHTR